MSFSALLEQSLRGDSSSPFECVASDIDNLAAMGAEALGLSKSSKKHSRKSGQMALPELAEWRSPVVAEVVSHPLLAAAFEPKTGSNSRGLLGVLGDCRFATLALAMHEGPGRVICADLPEDAKSKIGSVVSRPPEDFVAALQEMRSMYPGFSQGRTLEIHSVEEPIWREVSAVLIIRWLSDVVEDLAQSWPPGIPVVSLLEHELGGFGPPAGVLDIPRAWLEDRAFVSRTARYYEAAGP